MAAAQSRDTDTSDLASLWEDALADFKNSTSKDLTQWHFNSMQEAMDSTKQQANSFSSWRHDQGKVDAVRSLLGNNLKSIQRVVSGAQIVANAAGAFPPALPATMLMTAFTVVFQTFKDVKADYDRVAGFYTQMGSFFDQISMVENKSPKLAPFERCIRKVFSAMLTIAGIAADYKSKGRFKKWAKNLVDGGGDPKLSGAYGSMDDAIVKLHQAVGLATLSVLVDVQEVTTRIEGKTDSILVSQQEVKSITLDTNRNISAMREEQEEARMELGGIQRAMTTGFESVSRVEAQTQQLQADLKLMMNLALKQSASERQAEAKPEKSSKSGGGAAGSRRYKIAQVKHYFSDGAEARNIIRAQRREMSEAFVEGTAKWIFEDDTYKSWIAGVEPVIWLSGASGTGKSFLAHSVVAQLERQLDEPASVASFFFREDREALRTLRNALRCAVLQIADSSPSYLDDVAAEINKQNANDDPWSQFFTSRFPSDSRAHLYLVFDGVDEAYPADQQAIAALIRQLPGANLNIHILFTGRPTLEPLFGQEVPETLDMSRERIADDMQLLIAARIRSLPRLRQFHRQTKRRITQKIAEKADSMLYIEHMLRRLSAMGREGAVLKDLEKALPESLESVYKLLLKECQKGRTHAQYLTLKSLFAMLAYSQRPLSLEEAIDLVKLNDPDHTFDVEDEIMGRSARLLDLDRDDDDEIDIDDTNDGDADDGEDGTGNERHDELMNEKARTRIALQERSMRDYFLAINVEDDGLRTSPEHSHLLIFELLIRLLKAEAPDMEVEKPCLQGYAANYWAHHFVKIDVAAEHVTKVLEGISQIFNNEHNIAASFEAYNAPFYDDLNSQTSFLERFKAWLKLAEDVTDLPSGIQSWIKNLGDTPEKALLPLARGHVSNQFDPDNAHPVARIILYAQSALVIAGVFTASEDNNGDVIRVLEFFPDVDSKNVFALRSLSQIYQHRDEYKLSEEYANKALALDDPSARNRFRTHWTQSFNLYSAGRDMNREAIRVKNEGNAPTTDADTPEVTDGPSTNSGQPNGEAISSEETNRETTNETETKTLTSNGADPGLPGQAKLEEALQHIDAALALRPVDWIEHPKWVDLVEGVFYQRATVLRFLQRVDDTIAAHNESRSIRSDVDWYSADMIDELVNTEQLDINANMWAQDAVNPEKYFNIIESLKPGERQIWFTYLMEDDYLRGGYSSWALHKCAKRVGERGHKITVALYETYFKSIRRTSAKFARAKTDLALFYRIAADDLQKSCDITLEVLNVEYSDDDTDDLQEILYSARRSLCNTLFQLFRETNDPYEKVRHLDTIMALPLIKISVEGEDIDKQSWDELRESPVLLMQALMTRAVGSRVKYREMMESLFTTCVDGLTDTVGNNDSTSFRLLAKTLACVPGLYRDAQIAVSCQYSITDPEVEHNDEQPQGDGEQTEETNTETAQEDASHVDEKETNGDQDVKEAETSKDEIATLNSGIEGCTLEEAQAVVKVKIETTAMETTEPQLTELTAGLPDDVKVSTVSEAGEPRTDENAAKNEQDGKTKEEADEAEDVVGDLLPSRGTYCDGNCDYRAEDWTAGPLYMCIHCANCDLCDTCYEKRMAWNRGEPNTDQWLDWCNKDHAYVKGPIDGWRGVKNGVIRIGTEETKFEEWLRTLKEERWPKAWEDFWKAQSLFPATC